jgi:hypothetical protein
MLVTRSACIWTKFEIKQNGRRRTETEIEDCDVARLLPFGMIMHSDAENIVSTSRILICKLAN